MLIAFRVDASNRLGMGHLKRCLVLAEEACRGGHSCWFLTGSSDDEIVTLIRAKGHSVSVLTPAFENLSLLKNPDWSDTSLIELELNDSRESSALLRNIQPDVVILDHYFLTERWLEQILEAIKTKTVVIEDLDRRWRHPDMIVNCGIRGEVLTCSDFEGRVLVGPRYALIGREYREVRTYRDSVDTLGHRLVISVGGSDPTGLTEKLLEISDQSEFEGNPIDLVVGNQFGHQWSLKDSFKPRRRITIHRGLDSLAPLFRDAKVVLGAGGMSTWERACVGVASLVASTTENQRPICNEAQRAGITRYLGHADVFDLHAGRKELHRLMASDDERSLMALAGKITVDGFGAQRMLLMLEHSSAVAHIRDANRHDTYRLFDWVNEETTRMFSVSGGPIPFHEHRAWFQRALNESTRRIRILELNGLPIGQLRLDSHEDYCSITYSVDKDFRNRGFGKLLVQEALKMTRRNGINELRATVKLHNRASHNIFERFGFDISAQDSDVTHYQLKLK